MLIAIRKSTGRVIEMQSHATTGTLIDNAVIAGIDASDVEEREVTLDEYTVIMSAQDDRTYAEKRRVEYPPMADYLDGIAKGDQTQINAYIAACLAVKAKYPKP